MTHALRSSRTSRFTFRGLVHRCRSVRRQGKDRAGHLGNPLVLLAFVMLVSAVHGASQTCPELVGRWPYGPSHAIEIAGDRVFFGSGTALLMADVSTPQAPVLVAQMRLPDLPRGIAVTESHVYVAAESAGLRVIEVGPSTFTEVGFLDTPDWALDVAVANGYVYLADRDSGLRVIDVSDPAAPTETSVHPDTSNGASVAGGKLLSLIHI